MQIRATSTTLIGKAITTIELGSVLRIKTNYRKGSGRVSSTLAICHATTPKSEPSEQTNRTRYFFIQT